jgi:hypothetical protein
LPESIFSYQKRQFWFILEGRGMEIFDVFHGWPLGDFYCHFGVGSLWPPCIFVAILV